MATDVHWLKLPIVHWLKLPIVGMPGTECGRELVTGGDTRPTDFPNDGCTEPARWCVGMLLVCQKHAAFVASEFGDDIEQIEADWRASL